ncbi:sensor histidine kinase [Amylibacter ulvae]|uniref:histidine kinase n=1 Tax=Paramylibacter ulvae TaxID=1651968 RepID=A0ABQ3D3W4_9RHOB|nr:sensor histidine kinase [Amylibacter ulvae]GHA57460.1 sensor histidine kinase [Amylibacter ulvae]
MTLRFVSGSMRGRLVIQLALIAALLSLVLFLVVRTVAERAAADTQDNILLASATSISDALYTERGAVRLELPYSALSMLGSISEDRVFYRVAVGGETLTGYDDLPLPVSNDANQFDTYRYKGETVRAVALKRNFSTGNHSRDVTIVVAQTRLGLAAISSRITNTAMAIGVIFFLLATGLSLWAAQSALAPLTRMAGAVTRRGPSDLRPVVGKTPAELAPLVEALNSFILRLKASLNRSEDFIAEAAHRVRTPLATVRTQAEVVHRSLNQSQNKTALREMIRAIDESSRSAGQLLDHAMVNFRTDQFETAQLDLVELVKETTDRLSPTAGLKDIGINVAHDIPEFPFSGDAILLQNALRNILDNAIKYSPADSIITVNMTSDPEYQIAVIDQGRGFQGGDAQSYLNRFSRGENVDDVVGSGLGLTIVQEVAVAHFGRVEIQNNQTGSGACVSFILPRG